MTPLLKKAFAEACKLPAEERNIIAHFILDKLIPHTPPNSYQQYIEVIGGKRGGKACIKDTRITVSDVLAWLASGLSLQNIVTDYPELTTDSVKACLAYAAKREDAAGLLSLSGCSYRNNDKNAEINEDDVTGELLSLIIDIAYDLKLPSTEDSLRDSLLDAIEGRTLPIETLWDGIDDDLCIFESKLSRLSVLLSIRLGEQRLGSEGGVSHQDAEKRLEMIQDKLNDDSQKNLQFINDDDIVSERHQTVSTKEVDHLKSEKLIVRDSVKEVITSLPDNVSWEEAVHALEVRRSIDLGLADVKAGKLLTTDEVLASIEQSRVLGQHKGKIHMSEDFDSEISITITPKAHKVTFSDCDIIVHMVDGRTLSVPLAWFPKLFSSSTEQLYECELLGDGEGIYWPTLDVDLNVKNLF
jgi:uncharacterized protein (DUF433 family)/predicted transcriptional regulator